MPFDSAVPLRAVRLHRSETRTAPAFTRLRLMVNRVQPETGRAWDPKSDFAPVERSLREHERELSLRAVPETSSFGRQ